MRIIKAIGVPYLTFVDKKSDINFKPKSAKSREIANKLEKWLKRCRLISLQFAFFNYNIRFPSPQKELPELCSVLKQDSNSNSIRICVNSNYFFKMEHEKKIISGYPAVFRNIRKIDSNIVEIFESGSLYFYGKTEKFVSLEIDDAIELKRIILHIEVFWELIEYALQDCSDDFSEMFTKLIIGDDACVNSSASYNRRLHIQSNLPSMDLKELVKYSILHGNCNILPISEDHGEHHFIFSQSEWSEFCIIVSEFLNFIELEVVSAHQFNIHIWY